MPPETATAPAQADVKKTSANIAKGIQDRAAGKSQSSKGPEIPADGDEKGRVKEPAAIADPNAGKKKYSVEGRELWLTPEQADAYVQKGIAFEPRISELARMRQEMIQFERALLDNPGSIIMNLSKRANVPVQTLVEKVLSGTASDEVKEATGKWYWENVAKRVRMDPKDRAILERDERIKALEEQEQQKTSSALALENQQRIKSAMALVSGQIQESLKELGITNVDSVVGIQMAKRIADVMRLSYLARKPLTAKEAASRVRAEIREYQTSFYDQLDEDKLVEELGKENAEKVRKYFLKLMKQNEKDVKSEGASSPSTRRDERKIITPDQMHDYLEDLKRNGKK